MDAVVKIYCTHTEPNYSLPWQRKRQYSSTSSGFVVAGDGGQRYLLTNAHSVEYYSQVGARIRGCGWWAGGGGLHIGRPLRNALSSGNFPLPAFVCLPPTQLLLSAVHCPLTDCFDL